MPEYIASLEVDQRQRLILQADKLREMLGASRLIADTVEIAKRLLEQHSGVKLVTPVSGVLRLVCDDLNLPLRQLRTILKSRNAPCIASKPIAAASQEGATVA